MQARPAQPSTFTQSEYYQGLDGNGRPWASPTVDMYVYDNALLLFGGQIWTLLPGARQVGVDPNFTAVLSLGSHTVAGRGLGAHL